MASKILTPLLTRVRGVARDEDGIAAVEFALLLPFMLTMYLGMAELSQGLTVGSRVGVLAHSLADLAAAQANDNGTGSNSPSLSEAGMQNIFGAAAKMMAPMSTTNLKMTITEVAISSPSAGTWRADTTWSISKNGGTRRACAQLTPGNAAPVSLGTIPTSFVQTTAGQNPVVGSIIVADAIFSYTPLIHFKLLGWSSPPTFTFQRSAYSAVRSSSQHIQYWATSGANCQASH